MRTQGVRPRTILDDYSFKILGALSKKEYSITSLAVHLGVHFQNLQVKLGLLEEEGIIKLDRSGKGRTVIIKIVEKYKPIFNDFPLAKSGTPSLKDLLDLFVVIRNTINVHKEMIAELRKNK